VAVTDYCVYPPAAVAGLPRVGGTKNPDCAQILAVKPDLVLANWEENRPDDVAALQAAGVPVWVTFPCSVRGALDVLWATIQLFAAPHLSATLDALERSYEWTSQVAGHAPATRVFVPIWREPAAAAGRVDWWMTANRATYLHDVLRVCGGENVFGSRDRRYPLAADLDPERTPAEHDPGRDARYPRVSPAEVAAQAPDVILLPSEPYAFADADLAAFDEFPEMPAVSRRRIQLIDGTWLTWPGTRLAAALAELPSRLAPIPDRIDPLG
jgi:ABC-type Fe3+-hydroxamate transport system substrate-binding protein